MKIERIERKTRWNVFIGKHMKKNGSMRVVKNRREARALYNALLRHGFNAETFQCKNGIAVRKTK